jgi:RNA polymerase sigma factor (sigma-70 family)
MNKTTFEHAWHRGEPHVRAFLAAACRDAAVVQDLCQEVALAAWRKRGQFEAGRDFTAWIVGMARLALLRQRRDLAPDIVDSLAQTVVAEAETLDRHRHLLAACREQLAPSARRLLALRLGENLPLAEVATRLGRSHGAVRTARCRIRDRLRSCIEAGLAGRGPDVPSVSHPLQEMPHASPGEEV